MNKLLYWIARMSSKEGEGGGTRLKIGRQAGEKAYPWRPRT